MLILTERRVSRRRQWLLRAALGLVVVLGIAGWLGYQPALRRYKVWKQQRALTQAEEFIAKRDFPSAKIALELAMTAVPGDTATLRVAANLLDQVGSPDVMILRRRLLQLDPDSLEDRVSLINEALRHRDFNAARDALRDMPANQANRPDAIKAALYYELATDNRPMADALFDRLKALEPDNDRLKVLHALLRMKSPRPEVVAQARRELAPYIEDPHYTLFIRRDMLLAAMQRNDHPDARRLAKLIAADPHATLSDRVQEANFELNEDQRPFDGVFAGLVPWARDSRSAAELLRWTILADHPRQGADWVKILPAAWLGEPDLLAARAELAAALRDWDGLQALLEQGAWGQVDHDVVRLAFSARLLADRNNTALQREVWGEALSESAQSLTGLNLLYRLAGYWGWTSAGESTLWAIVRGYPMQAWAHQTLFNYYRQKGDTDNMRALIGALRDEDGSMPRYRHDWALLTLLTTSTSGWGPAKQTMADLYQSAPDNPNYATGYALALAQSGQTSAALEVLGKCTPEELGLPSRAPYLAYIYGMARRRAEFAKVSALEASLPNILPEEHALFSLGRAALDRPEDRPIQSAAGAAAEKQPAAAKPAGEANQEGGGGT